MRSLLSKDVARCALLGDHNVYFYASHRKKHRVLFSNLRVGLDRGYSAFYISSGESVEQVRAEIKNFGLKFDNPVKLNVATSRRFYMPDGEFHAERVVEQFRSLVDESVDRGFEGLFVSSDAAGAFDCLSENLVAWLEYESSFGRVFKFPMEAICAYRKDQLESNGEALLQLIQAHKNAITVKTTSFVDTRELCTEAITQELRNVFGVETANVILRWVERLLNIPRSGIPDQMENFNNALKSILGDSATIISQRILRNLYAKMQLEYR